MKSLILILGLTVSAVSVSAQHSITIGLGGGAAIPVGKLDSTYAAGPDALVTLAAGPADSPFGLRLDYNYDGFHGRNAAGKNLGGTHINSVTGNVLFTVRTGALKPYAIAGGGWYPYRDPGAAKRTNAWGENVGLGFGFPLPYSGIGGFIEARYHVVNVPHHSTRHFVPITLGVMF